MKLGKMKWIIPYLLISLPISANYKQTEKKQNMKFFVEYVANLSCIQTLKVLKRNKKIDNNTNIVYICNTSGKELLKEMEKAGSFDATN